MPSHPVVFENVSKAFRRGETFNSLRDLIPSLARGLSNKRQSVREDFWALRDVSFAVGRGEALGIIGRNGAGKSTTLKILTRILKPTRGRSLVTGRIGALIEIAAGFHPDLTGRENVFLQGAVMGMKRSEILARFDDIVEFAGVSAFIDTPVKRYSSGMNARLGFSIAANLQPDVMIIDEVLSVGDMSFQARCVQRMKQFLRDGVSIVFVSHNLQAVTDLCNSAVLLAGGVTTQGRTSEVIARYLSDEPVTAVARTATDVTITGCKLTAPDGRIPESISPGSPLTLHVTYTSHCDVTDLTFGFLIRRSTDHLIVYDGNVPTTELGLTSLKAGQTITVSYAFEPHVTRGHYHVETHVFHNPTHRFLDRFSPAGTFAVEESRTYAGIADVRLRPQLLSDLVARRLTAV